MSGGAGVLPLWGYVPVPAVPPGRVEGVGLFSTYAFNSPERRSSCPPQSGHRYIAKVLITTRPVFGKRAQSISIGCEEHSGWIVQQHPMWKAGRWIAA